LLPAPLPQPGCFIFSSPLLGSFLLFPSPCSILPLVAAAAAPCSPST
jgi:hypothetical protein